MVSKSLTSGLTKLPFNKNSVKKLPKDAGVYLFFNSEGKTIYIGKSKNLPSRVDSYLGGGLSAKTTELVRDIYSLSFIRVNSELESLLLEANLIRKYLPKFNIQLRDDKHPLYIRITKEEFPRILTARKKDENEENLAFFGPFPSSSTVKAVLRMLRKIFPYSQHKLGKSTCLYNQIGLCDPCPNEINKLQGQARLVLRKKYLRNITSIRHILENRLTWVQKELASQMNKLAKSERFEEAKFYKDKLTQLTYITQPVTSVELFIDNPNLVSDRRKEEQQALLLILKPFFPELKSVGRIECYDIAHLAGNLPTASMVCFIEGEPDKKYYRHFRIRQTKGSDDISSMREVIKRRKKHFDSWGRPDLIIVDGGKAQTGVFREELADSEIAFVGLAKRLEILIIPLPGGGFKEIQAKAPALYLVSRLRDEAHRFARRYHHKLLSRAFLQKS